MGLFGSSKKTYVSSVAYPLGEDGEDRTNTLQYTVLNALLQERPIAESITQTYMRGQGMSLRNAFPYARDVYTNSVPRSHVLLLDQPDLSELQALLQAENPGATIHFVNTLVGTADFVWWAEQHLAKEFGYDRVVGQFMHPPKGVDVNAALAYDLEPSGLIRILMMNADTSTHVETFRPVGFSRMKNYVHACYQTTQVFGGETTTVTRPAEEGEEDSTSNTFTIVDRSGEIQRTDVRTTVVVSGSEATVTTATTITVTSRPRYFIYAVGSGTYPALDAWIQQDAATSPFYPSIPLRVDNDDWTDEAHQRTDLYKTSKKLLDKVGIKLEELAESINDNEQINEIDYAFAVFGVGLKTKSQEGKRYLFRFFENLRNVSSVTQAHYKAWEDAFLLNQDSNVVSPQTNVLQIYSEKERANNHDIKLQWQYIDTTLLPGKVSENAKPGDVEISMSGTRREFNLHVDMVLDSSMLYARRQVDEDTYEEMAIAGLTYENFIYRGKSVTITAYDAFHDEDENGFIIPLNQTIVRVTPLIELTDLAYQCMHLVFNCYKVVKKKWYQTGWFKILLIIVAIIVIVVTWGSATPAVVTTMAGIMGGTTLAIVLAATIYVLAGMVLMNVLTKVATDLFGEQWGAVIAIIASFVILNWGNIASIANGAASITAQTVLQATTAVFNAYGAYAAGELTEIQKEALGLQTEFDKQMKEIEELTKQNLDTSLDMIDIQGYTDSTKLMIYEPLDTFLTRTLLTGSDICAITSGMIENFTEVGLQLPTTG